MACACKMPVRHWHEEFKCSVTLGETVHLAHLRCQWMDFQDASSYTSTLPGGHFTYTSTLPSGRKQMLRCSVHYPHQLGFHMPTVAFNPLRICPCHWIDEVDSVVDRFMLIIPATFRYTAYWYDLINVPDAMFCWMIERFVASTWNM